MTDLPTGQTTKKEKEKKKDRQTKSIKKKIRRQEKSLTLELDHGDEVGVGRDCVDALPLTQIPDHDAVVLAAGGHMETEDKGKEKAFNKMHRLTTMTGC